MAQAKRLADTYDLDTLESLLPDDPKCVQCGEVRAWRRPGPPSGPTGLINTPPGASCDSTVSSDSSLGAAAPM